jgi:hypothetical protein
MNKTLYTEEQPIPHKLKTLIFGGAIGILVIACITSLFFNIFALAGITVLLSFIIILLLRWMRSIKLVAEIFDDRIAVAYKGKFAPQGMFISDLNFKAVIAFEDTNEFPFKWIANFNIHQYDAIKDFGGWGERYGSRRRGTENTKTFTASGNQAILLTLTSGEKILIGTQESQSFFLALQSVFGK